MHPEDYDCQTMDEVGRALHLFVGWELEHSEEMDEFHERLTYVWSTEDGTDFALVDPKTSKYLIDHSPEYYPRNMDIDETAAYSIRVGGHSYPDSYDQLLRIANISHDFPLIHWRYIQHGSGMTYTPGKGISYYELG